MTLIQFRVLATHGARGFHDVVPQTRGSRECRVLAAPAVSCANSAKRTHTSIQVQPEHSGIPCAMALRLMPRSPRRRIRLVTVVGGLRLIKLGRVDFASAQLGTSKLRFARKRILSLSRTKRTRMLLHGDSSDYLPAVQSSRILRSITPPPEIKSFLRRRRKPSRRPNKKAPDDTGALDVLLQRDRLSALQRRVQPNRIYSSSRLGQYCRVC
jgi:hypothetical protein